MADSTGISQIIISFLIPRQRFEICFDRLLFYCENPPPSGRNKAPRRGRAHQAVSQEADVCE